MNRLNVFRLFFFALLALGAAAEVHAQATRTWVSGVGDDANPCSRTAPCKTFAGAISKTAPGGEINCLDPGGFGAVTITKAIEIDCSNGSGIAGVLVSGTNAIIVSAGPSDTVVLRNLDINGLGTGIDGIRYLSGRTLHVENCRIYGFQNGIDFLPTSAANSLTVHGTKLANNSGDGIHISTITTNSAAIKGSITDTVMQRNGRGMFVGDHAFVAVDNSVSTDNATDGFVANGTTNTAVVVIENSTSSLNGGSGVNAMAVSTIRIGRNQITGNATGLTFSGGGLSLQSFGSNDVTGNGTNGTPSVTIGTI